MSEGPIKAERDAWKPPTVSTTNKARVCTRVPDTNRALCGRRSAPLADHKGTTCADCLAAARADAETTTPNDNTKEPEL